MKKSFLFFSFLSALIGSSTFCQEYYTVIGTIYDKATHAILPFAQISISHSALGTASNTDGHFEFNIPTGLLNDSLVVYYLGYDTYKERISGMLNKENEIRLTPVVLSLSEVEVVGLTAQEVIRRAVANIPLNYGPDPEILTAFIRVQKRINNRLAEFAEAIVRDEKNGYYHYPGKELPDKYKKSNLPELVKARVRSDTALVNSLDEVGRNAYCLSCYFTRDIVEFYPNSILDEKDFKLYDFHMEEMTGRDMKKIYHIRFDQKDKVRKSLWQGELFIDAGSFASKK